MNQKLTEIERVICGDALAIMPRLAPDSVNLALTSPPYFGLRDYGVSGQIGIESSVSEYLGKLEPVLRELHRVVCDSGACFIVVGDTYRNQQLQLVPHRIAILAQELGRIVRNDIIWHKLAPPRKPDKSLADRP